MKLAALGLDLEPSADSETELDDLRAEALRSLLPGILISGFLPVFAIAFGLLPESITFSSLAVAGALWGSCLLSYLGLRSGVKAASAGLVIGLTLAVSASIHLFPQTIFACGFSLVVAIAGLLLGPVYSLIVAAGATTILVLDMTGPRAVPVDVVVGAMCLVWASAFLSWLTSRPLFDALGWSWSAYQRAQQKTEEARLRQAESVKLSRNLNEAYCRLESLNEKLRHARRMAEEARRLKAEFASTVSHELRTPLNLIIGFSEMIIMAPQNTRESAIPDVYRGDVEAIYRNACHLSNLIDDILDLAQVEARRMGLKREYSSLEEIAREAIAGVATLYSERGLYVSLEIPADLPAVFVDRLRVRQVLINLLANAARFIEEGGVTVSGRVQGDEVLVSVADTGVGIPPEDLPKVFQEFSRLEGGSIRKHSGLGLAICRRFVELHRGRIWVEATRAEDNTNGKHGTTFHFTLPIHEVPTGVVLGESSLFAQQKDGRYSDVKRSLLVVDENPQVPTLFQRYLEGCEIGEAANLEIALQMNEQERLHAVLTSAPRTSSDRQRLERLSEAAPYLPILTYTLSGPWEVKDALGAVGYLSKPVTAEQLRSALAGVSEELRRVLIVDDEPQMIDLLQKMVLLHRPSCEIWRASNGLEALELLEKGLPDVVLLDLCMPKLDGAGFLKVLRSRSEWCALPVIVVTAHGPEATPVVATQFSVSRADGIPVGELMRCLQAVLGALDPTGPSVEEQPATRWGALAWLETPPHPETTPAHSPEELSIR